MWIISEREITMDFDRFLYVHWRVTKSTNTYINTSIYSHQMNGFIPQKPLKKLASGKSAIVRCAIKCYKPPLSSIYSGFSHEKWWIFPFFSWIFPKTFPWYYQCPMIFPALDDTSNHSWRRKVNIKQGLQK